MLQRFREWLWTVGTRAALVCLYVAEWIGGLLKRRDDPACEVLELDESDGRKMWGTSPDEQPYRRRYFRISSKLELSEDVQQCAHNNGLPRIDDPHPYTGDPANDIQLRQDEIGDVWQAMVTYREPTE